MNYEQKKRYFKRILSNKDLMNKYNIKEEELSQSE
jgi:hypothetical protein